ncbi:MAG: hypothetical protein QXG05_06215 [Nitrososphaerota archaeon]
MLSQTAVMILIAQHKSNVTPYDSTGLPTIKYGRCFEVKNSRQNEKKKFVKLPRITNDAEMP